MAPSEENVGLTGFAISSQFSIEFSFLLAPEQGLYLSGAVFHNLCRKLVPVRL
jgi:hypothetical protein